VTSATTSTDAAAMTVAGTRSAQTWSVMSAVSRTSHGVNGGWSV